MRSSHLPGRCPGCGLWPGQRVTFYAAPGEHIIGSNRTGPICASGRTNELLQVSEAGKQRTLRTAANFDGVVVMPTAF